MSRLPDLHGLLAATFLAASGCLLTAADVVVAEKKEAPKPKVTLAPEVETKFADFMKKVTEAKRKAWGTRMKKEIEKVAKVTSLEEEKSKALESAGMQATDACLDGWLSKLAESWRKYLGEQSPEAAEIEQMFSQSDEAAQSDWFGEYVRPFEHSIWEDGLRRTLTAEQFATWEKSQKERSEAVRKEAAGMLKVSVERVCEQQRQSLLTNVATIKSALALSKERVEKLEALAKTVTDGIAESLRERAEKMVFAMEDDARRQLLKSRQFYMGLETKDLEAQQAAWKEGLAKLLGPDEEERLKAVQEGIKAKRATVMGKIMLVQLDEQVAFTASQRERLQPIAERLVKEQTSLFPDANPERFYRLDPQLLFTAGAKAKEEEMKSILDANQWKHWHEACLATNYREGRIRVVSKKPKPAEPKAPARAAEPEDLENAFSDFFHEKTATERKRLLAINLLKAEDAARVAGVAPEAVGRLEIAARGAAEDTLATWKPNIESSIRSQMRDATPESVKQRLASMESYFYSRNSTGAGTTPVPFWDTTVKAELTEAQRAAWQKELDARTAFRDRSIAAMIMAEFDRRIPLGTEQWSKLEPIIAKAVGDYSPDIMMMFSSSYPWYLQSYSMFIPFAAAPEKELKEILSKEQWESWSKSEEIGNISNYWENVQRSHTQRVKTKK